MFQYRNHRPAGHAGVAQVEASQRLRMAPQFFERRRIQMRQRLRCLGDEARQGGGRLVSNGVHPRRARCFYFRRLSTMLLATLAAGTL